MQAHRQLLCHCGAFFLLLVARYTWRALAVYSHIMWCMHVCGFLRCPCLEGILLASVAHSIVFSSRIGAITEYSQLENGMDPHFKSHISIEDPSRRNVALNFIKWAEKTRRASAQQKLISALDKIRNYNLLIDKLTSYQLTTTAS